MIESAQTKPLVGISSCLLGQQVRFDGGHKKDGWITGPLAEFFDYVPVCPEVAIGLGVPRPTIHLVGDPERPRAVGSRDPSLDVTSRLESFARQQVPLLGEISGYILKSKSPSCGMARVPVTSDKGMPAKVGVGIYARVLMERKPLLPVEEDGRLNDAVLRENFVTRVYVLHRWQQLRAGRLTAAKLIDFHSRQKYLVMAHSQAAYQRLGQMLAHLKQVDLEAVADMYAAELMTALARRVTRRRHVNVLHHVMGYLKDHIDAGDKAELIASIEAYRREEVALVVPMTLLRHHLRRHPDPYMQQQVYLAPHPEKLALRGAI
ncbi:MAG: DUF523 and DUF1722 domain-containing protein [Gammaproteobacteria bacterium]|jgi:uncharacterized protein YbgA (DUF1722 family)/uncharacterized protein YbbK (DUF523 family)|nr:DUF523 and DUF1722 domain-containing protein [Gammaproteobacteria bacterium]